MLRSLKTRRALIGCGGVIAVVIVLLYFLSNRWSPGEIEQVRELQAAIFDVQMAIDYVNRRGGAIDPDQARDVLAYYEKAKAHAAMVDDALLSKIHPDLTRVWPEIFRKSTEMYVGALQATDRDGARQAALLQDDWIRWYNLNKRKMTIPDAAKAAPGIAIITSVAPRKDKID